MSPTDSSAATSGGVDAGTHASLLEASSFVHAIQHRAEMMIACHKQLAWRMGLIAAAAPAVLAAALPAEYDDYLRPSTPKPP